MAGKRFFPAFPVCIFANSVSNFGVCRHSPTALLRRFRTVLRGFNRPARKTFGEDSRIRDSVRAPAFPRRLGGSSQKRKSGIHHNPVERATYHCSSLNFPSDAMTRGTPHAAPALVRQLAAHLFAAGRRPGHPRLAAVFSAGAVLQARPGDPVWGTARPAKRILCHARRPGAHTVAHPVDGRFFLRLPVRPAASRLRMTVENLSSGEKIEVCDLAVGEVYLVAGQSNMEYPLRDCAGAAEAIANAADPDLRYYRMALNAVIGEQTALDGHWITATPETAGDCSGIAYFFAANSGPGFKCGGISKSAAAAST